MKGKILKYCTDKLHQVNYTKLKKQASPTKKRQDRLLAR